jgi:hypothetical protein
VRRPREAPPPARLPVLTRQDDDGYRRGDVVVVDPPRLDCRAVDAEDVLTEGERRVVVEQPHVRQDVPAVAAGGRAGRKEGQRARSGSGRASSTTLAASRPALDSHPVRRAPVVLEEGVRERPEDWEDDEDDVRPVLELVVLVAEKQLVLQMCRLKGAGAGGSCRARSCAPPPSHPAPLTRTLTCPRKRRTKMLPVSGRIASRDSVCSRSSATASRSSAR